MNTYEQAISLYQRVAAFANLSTMRQANVGWKFNNTLHWNLINKAASLARIEFREREENIYGDNDAIKTAVASLRHFIRRINPQGTCEIGHKEIKDCLKLDVEINTQTIEKAARDQMARELHNKMRSTGEIVARRLELTRQKMEAAQAIAQLNRAILDEVYFICNSSDTEFDDGHVIQDADACDWDAQGYLIEDLPARLVNPVLEMIRFVESKRDAAEITSKIIECEKQLTEINKLADEIGIDKDKVAARTALAEQRLAESDAAIDNTNADVEAAMAAADEIIDSKPKQGDYVETVNRGKRIRVPKVALVASGIAEEKAAETTKKAKPSKSYDPEAFQAKLEAISA